MSSLTMISILMALTIAFTVLVIFTYPFFKYEMYYKMAVIDQILASIGYSTITIIHYKNEESIPVMQITFSSDQAGEIILYAIIVAIMIFMISVMYDRSLYSKEKYEREEAEKNKFNSK